MDSAFIQKSCRALECPFWIVQQVRLVPQNERETFWKIQDPKKGE